MSTKPTATRSATRTPTRKRSKEREDALIHLNNGTVLDPRAPWPFPLSVCTKEPAK